jgi:hypothetical protein
MKSIKPIPRYAASAECSAAWRTHGDLWALGNFVPGHLGGKKASSPRTTFPSAIRSKQERQKHSQARERMPIAWLVNVRTITARGYLLVYALTAYLLNINKVIDNNDVMDSKSLPQVKMPNRDGFFPEFPKLMPRKSGIQFP